MTNSSFPELEVVPTDEAVNWQIKRYIDQGKTHVKYHVDPKSKRRNYTVRKKFVNTVKFTLKRRVI
jgi:hypothetical protein